MNDRKSSCFGISSLTHEVFDHGLELLIWESQAASIQTQPAMIRSGRLYHSEVGQIELVAQRLDGISDVFGVCWLVKLIRNSLGIFIENQKDQ